MKVKTDAIPIIKEEWWVTREYEDFRNRDQPVCWKEMSGTGMKDIYTPEGVLLTICQVSIQECGQCKYYQICNNIMTNTICKH